MAESELTVDNIVGVAAPRGNRVSQSDRLLMCDRKITDRMSSAAIEPNLSRLRGQYNRADIIISEQVMVNLAIAPSTSI